jgi:hypothetical protein
MVKNDEVSNFIGDNSFPELSLHLPLDCPSVRPFLTHPTGSKLAVYAHIGDLKAARARSLLRETSATCLPTCVGFCGSRTDGRQRRFGPMYD